MSCYVSWVSQATGRLLGSSIVGIGAKEFPFSSQFYYAKVHSVYVPLRRYTESLNVPC